MLLTEDVEVRCLDGFAPKFLPPQLGQGAPVGSFDIGLNVHRLDIAQETGDSRHLEYATQDGRPILERAKRIPAPTRESFLTPRQDKGQTCPHKFRPVMPRPREEVFVPKVLA